MFWAEVCVSAAVALAMRGPHGVHAALAVRQAADALRDAAARLRYPAFNEAVVDAERSGAAEEARAAHGLAPALPPRLHVVS